MAFTTYAAFVPALMDMTVDGVSTVLDEPPTQLSTSMLPLMYPRLPTGNNEVAAFNVDVGLSEASCEVIVVIEPLRQNTQSANFAASLTMMDALGTALTADALAIGIDGWTMRVEIDAIGDVAYWLLVATVEASG